MVTTQRPHSKTITGAPSGLDATITSDSPWLLKQGGKARASIAVNSDAAVSVISSPCDVPQMSTTSSSSSPSPPSLSPPSQFSGILSPHNLLFRAGADEGLSASIPRVTLRASELIQSLNRPQLLMLRAEGQDGKHIVTEAPEESGALSASAILPISRNPPVLRRSHSEGSLCTRYASASGMSPPSDSSLPTPIESPLTRPETPKDSESQPGSTAGSPSDMTAFLANDLSAYVSGIGDPVDPDTELSSVVQLQAFRMHSRSRSVGPGYQRSPRMYQHIDGDRARMRKPPFTLASPPHPPLFNQDTFDLEPLPPAVAPAPTASRQPSPVQKPAVAEPIPNIPRLNSPDIDEDGFRKVRPRHHRSRAHRASRPRAEEPQPLDMSAFDERESEEEEEEERGRGRGRSRNRLQPSMRRRAMAVDSTSPRSGLPPNARVPSSPIKAKPVGASRMRVSGMTFAEAAAQEGRDARGRQENVKLVTSSSRELAPEDDEALARGDASALSRTRLLSNGAHLLMLSCELAMMRSKKINAPLRPRWGKRRDDDFCPISSPMLSPSSAESINGSPLRFSWTA
ncbi:hypothetical protein MCUN1_003261 [Malassezia cuniculi]|uniref:Uncharacterized protein n=1 Tax=Malassezia cuniculi TaxID=948313 RepID=A0AAF0F135_9BASI|nr:hypothetical protein MCUN1_003261 [Malassezia cuniculi]